MRVHVSTERPSQAIDKRYGPHAGIEREELKVRHSLNFSLLPAFFFFFFFLQVQT
jgi:hypothetical protein